MADYAFTRGDSLILNLTVTQRDGNVLVPVDLTNATIWMTAKKKYSDPDPGVFQIRTPDDIKIDANPATGKAKIVVPGPATTSLRYDPNSLRVELVYDVQVKTPDGIVQTVAKGKLLVDQDVTQIEA